MDPTQLCYLCDRPINVAGKASEEHPGVCWECDEKENPKKQAAREQERRVQGAPTSSHNPLLRKSGAPRLAKSPLQKHFESNPDVPQAPYKSPPKEAGYDPDGPNPLNR